ARASSSTWRSPATSSRRAAPGSRTRGSGSARAGRTPRTSCASTRRCTPPSRRRCWRCTRSSAAARACRSRCRPRARARARATAASPAARRPVAGARRPEQQRRLCPAGRPRRSRGDRRGASTRSRGPAPSGAAAVAHRASRGRREPRRGRREARQFCAAISPVRHCTSTPNTRAPERSLPYCLCKQNAQKRGHGIEEAAAPPVPCLLEGEATPMRSFRRACALLAASAPLALSAACGDPELKSELVPEGPPVVTEVNVLSEIFDPNIDYLTLGERATFCREGEEYKVNQFYCPVERDDTGAPIPGVRGVEPHTQTIPHGQLAGYSDIWHVRLIF